MAPARPPTTRDGHSRAFQTIKKQARFQSAMAKRVVPVSTMSSSSSSDMDLDDVEGTPLEGLPSRRPLTRLPDVYFNESLSIDTGRKLPVSPNIFSASPTERSKPKASAPLRKAVLKKEVIKKEVLRKAVFQEETPQKQPSSDPKTPASENTPKDSEGDVIIIEDADDDVFTIEYPGSSSSSSSASSSPATSTSSFSPIFGTSSMKKASKKKDYSDPTYLCFQCKGERCPKMVAQRSGRCKPCAAAFRHKRYVLKQVALGRMVVDKPTYEIMAGKIPLLT